MKDSEDVQKLLRLKRYESPGEDYFQQFAEEFKDRQRSELLRGSARSLLFERVNIWLDEISPNRWAVPASAAACAAAIAAGGFLFVNSSSETNSRDAVAVTQDAGATLPDFPETVGETIELSLPKPSSRVPGETARGSENVLTAGAGMGLREL